MDGLLKVHQRVVDDDKDSTYGPPGGPATITTRLLVAGAQGGSLIGKQGATIKTIQDSSNCKIRVMEENLPIFALPDDSVVEIHGDPTVLLVHLRCKCKCQVPVQIRRWPLPNLGEHHLLKVSQVVAPALDPIILCHLSTNLTTTIQGSSPLDQQPRQGPPSYGRAPSTGTPHTPSVQSQQSTVAKVSQNMQIPLSYADAVIGTAGTNISYIRRASGATIAIQETRGVPDEMTVEINGSASQVQTAQQLIQNFVAEAATAAQNSTAPPPAQGGYNPYPGHAPDYPSQPPPAAHGPPAAEYGGPVYGGNYGY
ncbi:hypothetical protein L1987_82811 [Smallanthus sonchifolius]|uniref:Uncharacterized protein n=1 Tax=Smallanthus sonchifolius TaxID=185202 RepID=A0ACB8YBN9_9ASTR|nr:hypothetical protein L1987_82811 [Smallanthus sonchifolius]